MHNGACLAMHAAHLVPLARKNGVVVHPSERQCSGFTYAYNTISSNNTGPWGTETSAMVQILVADAHAEST